MKGLYTWVSNQISQRFSTVVDQYVPAPLQEIIGNVADQTNATFSAILNPYPIIAIYHSPSAQTSFAQSFYTNVIYYALPLAIYQIAMNQLPEDDETSSMVYSAFYASFLLGGTAFKLRGWTRLQIQKLIVNLSVAKQGKLFVQEYSLNKDYIPVEQDKLASVIADITDGVEYLIDKQIILRLIAGIPSVGPKAAFFLNLLVEGKALLGYKLSVLGLSREQRQEILAKNLYFAFALAAEWYGSAYALRKLASMADIPCPELMQQAVLDVLFPYFILIVLLNQQPLPGKKNSVDAFYYIHQAIYFSLHRALHFIVHAISKAQQHIDWKHLFSTIKDYPVTNVLRTFFLHEDLESIEALTINPLTRNFFDIYAVDLKNIAELIESIREQPLAYLYKKLPLKWWLLDMVVPNESLQTMRVSQKIVKVLFKDEIQSILDTIKAILNSLPEKTHNRTPNNTLTNLIKDDYLGDKKKPMRLTNTTQQSHLLFSQKPTGKKPISLTVEPEKEDDGDMFGFEKLDTRLEDEWRKVKTPSASNYQTVLRQRKRV